MVIDCNVFVSCLSAKSYCHDVLQALIQGRFTLVLSTEIYLEYREILHAKYPAAVADLFFEALEYAPNVAAFIPFYTWNLIEADADDNKYTDVYIAAAADYLVTNDSHFNVLKTIAFPTVQVVNVVEFLAILKNTPLPKPQ